MKHLFTSKTFLIGLLSVIIGILTMLKGEIVAGQAITLEGIIMMLMRTITTEGVFITPKVG